MKACHGPRSFEHGVHEIGGSRCAHDLVGLISGKFLTTQRYMLQRMVPLGSCLPRWRLPPSCTVCFHWLRSKYCHHTMHFLFVAPVCAPTSIKQLYKQTNKQTHKQTNKPSTAAGRGAVLPGGLLGSLRPERPIRCVGSPFSHAALPVCRAAH